MKASGIAEQILQVVADWTSCNGPKEFILSQEFSFSSDILEVLRPDGAKNPPQRFNKGVQVSLKQDGIKNLSDLINEMGQWIKTEMRWISNRALKTLIKYLLDNSLLDPNRPLCEKSFDKNTVPYTSSKRKSGDKRGKRGAKAKEDQEKGKTPPAPYRRVNPRRKPPRVMV